MRPNRKPHAVIPAADEPGVPDMDILEFTGGENQRARLDKERQIATPDTELLDASSRRAEEDEP
jgi:hypothetical protein